MVEKFWFVWNPHGLVPSHKHQSMEQARAEAERLARLNNGHMFHVLEWRCSCIKSEVQWQTDGQQDLIGIPF